MTLVLILAWILLGLLAGTLAYAARWGFRAIGITGRTALLATLGLGVAAALLGAGLGWVIFGRFFATPMALWIAVVVASGGPWLVCRIQKRRSAAGSSANVPNSTNAK